MLAILGFIVALLVVWLLCGALCLLLHELGHAGVALLIQAEPVSVFVGSYGVASWPVRLGRLQLHFHPNVLTWTRRGMCRVDGERLRAASRPRQLLYVLAGPLLPLLVAGVGLALVFTVLASADNVAKAPFFCFAAMAVLGLVQNLWPSRLPMGYSNGRPLYNDGHNLRLVQHQARLAQLAAAVTADFTAGRYAACLEPLRELLRYYHAPLYYQLLVRSQLALAHYAAALVTGREFWRLLPARHTDDDRFTLGLLYSWTDQHADALAHYTALIEQAPPYAQAYNNRGYTQLELGQYQLALLDFNQAIALKANPAYAYANRGLARLRLGQAADGLADIRHALLLDPTEAYAHRNLGVYYLDQGEATTALGHFEQARTHSPHTHGLARYTQAAQAQLGRNKGDATGVL